MWTSCPRGPLPVPDICISITGTSSPLLWSFSLFHYYSPYIHYVVSLILCKGYRRSKEFMILLLLILLRFLTRKGFLKKKKLCTVWTVSTACPFSCQVPDWWLCHWSLFFQRRCGCILQTMGYPIWFLSLLYQDCLLFVYQTHWCSVILWEYLINV